MSSIHLLPEHLRNQIAAGEVVERPASIVKELVENAIDAGATAIEIKILGGGIEKIEIHDNGKGMSREDAEMCFSRYATSKISTSDDLFSLCTFGFRGEAIAAIASVSQMSITTRTKKSSSGVTAKGSEGRIEITPTGCPEGTTVIVENLFWNTPARRKFLKNSSTEWREIAKVLESFALAHPGISFRGEHEGKMAMDLPGEHVSEEAGEKKALKNRITALFGKDFSLHLLPIAYMGTDIQISGFCTHPHLHRALKDRQFLWVNDRNIIPDKNIDIAVYRAYESLIPKGRKPAFFLSITIDPSLVDVNVHPRKSEVRFFHSLYDIVKGAFESALHEEYKGFGGIPMERGTTEQIDPLPREGFLDKYKRSPQPYHSNIFHQKNFSPQKSISAFSSPLFSHHQEEEMSPSSSPPELFEESSVKKRKVIGQIKKSFLVIEEEDGILLLDQHAVHERVRYEELIKRVREHTPLSQPLLSPLVFSVSPSEKALLLSEISQLEALGFDIAEFGTSEISISALPSGMGEKTGEALLKDIIEDLSSPHAHEGKATKSIEERIATYAACRGAIKFGDALTIPEIESLLEQWEACGKGFSCAHGRPVYKKILFSELEHEHGR